jgi:hypothetical protein
VYDAAAMPIDAYLNSVADKLATIGLKRLQEKPLVPMDQDIELLSRHLPKAGTNPVPRRMVRA